MKVVVDPAKIEAIADQIGSLNGIKGQTSTVPVFNNDLLNGVIVNKDEINFQPGVSPQKGIVMNPDGTIIVSPGTKAGEYMYPYTICEKLNPNNCSTTFVGIKVAVPAIEILKTSNRKEVFAADDIITYTLKVTNTGNTVLKGIVVRDIMFPTWNQEISELAAGSSQSFDIDYLVSQDVVNAGTSIVNQASVQATDEQGYAVDAKAEITTPIIQKGQLSVQKIADKTVVNQQNEVITYHITVKNTGNITMSDILVTDPLTGLQERINELSVGEEHIFETQYITKRSDFDTDKIVNTAVAKGVDPSGKTIVAEGSVQVTVQALEIRIPNVFTPNGDGFNDFFEIEGIEGLDRVDLIVINRWGNEVYKNSNYKNNWDGRGLNDGTYYYVIQAVSKGQSTTYKGWVLIKSK